jgi:hypothetical protein
MGTILHTSRFDDKTELLIYGLMCFGLGILLGLLL